VLLSHVRGEYTPSAGGPALGVSVQLAGPPFGYQWATCGNRKLVPRGRVIHARYRLRQYRWQEMSARALRRVAHQDGLVHQKTLYADCFR
jgi:hypothetical protein